ncbi:MAG TPA: DUF1206 domain-containing protein [Pseudonocardiaceae bacterium]|jgi:hypothetical protein
MDTATRHADSSWPVRWLGRFGDVCYGIVHLLGAWLVVRTTFGAPVTGALLWVLTIGLIIFGAWQILLSTNGFRWIVAGGERTTRRAAAGNGTRRLLRLPGGRLVVLVVGLGVLVACVLSVRSGLGKRFLRDLDTGAMPTRARRRTEVLGTLGFLAKAVAHAVIGVLVCTAAVLVDPRTGGLGRALRALAAQPLGAGLLIVVAIGFVAFGVYCFADARYRRG